MAKLVLFLDSTKQLTQKVSLYFVFCDRFERLLKSHFADKVPIMVTADFDDFVLFLYFYCINHRLIRKNNVILQRVGLR